MKTYVIMLYFLWVGIFLFGTLATIIFNSSVNYDAEINCNTGNIDLQYKHNFTNSTIPVFELNNLNDMGCEIKVKGEMPLIVAVMLG